MTDTPGPTEPTEPEHHDHVTAEDVIEELFVEAFEHADGGESGRAKRKARVEIKVVTTS